jgi:hypothetical protein
MAMRRFVRTVAAAALIGAGSAAAQDGPIEGVIQSQVDAFLAGDARAAFSHASPGIKDLFGTPERFARMVQQGYPMVWRPSEVRYLERRALGEGVIQRVLMRDGAGVPWVLEYQMIEGPEGWVIDGVRIVEAPEFGA